ncbi:MAG: aspartate kinase [Chitinophagales bacterium]|jgi:aspartate kinase|nr:aspartate kinase [Chitinophagales bacterium]
MQVFKFGGASVKNAAAVRNVAQIIKGFSGEKLVVIVSAMGKTTNALEEVVNAHYQKNTQQALDLLAAIKNNHISIVQELMTDANNAVYEQLNQTFRVVEDRLQQGATSNYGFEYDQIVSLGELLATQIVAAYLNTVDIASQWLDVRHLVHTDNTYREGQIQWKTTEKDIPTAIHAVWESGKIALTQGFLGGTPEGFTTTLGREGSDYTAAVFANILESQGMTVWKDVPGILNADPRLVENTVKIPVLSYYEAIEMTYYGAHVIHPKTIKPLQNKGIPLYVRSFVKPDEVGTVVQTELPANTQLPPVVVIKSNQLLVSVFSNDFSFMAEENLSDIYELFAAHRIKTNLTQNAAISFSACIDNTPMRIEALLEALEEDYTVYKNEGLTLITIRHYTPEALEQHTEGREILLSQKSRHTIQMVVR